MRTYNNEVKYGDFVEDNKEEILKSAVNAINPDYMGMTRDEALTLAGSMKNCGFSRGDFADVMGRSAQNKGTFEKQWDKIRGRGTHGNCTEGTIFEYAKRSGWKWPRPDVNGIKDNPSKPKAKAYKMCTKWRDDITVSCIFDSQEYKNKPQNSWEIRQREKVGAAPPAPVSVQEFAQAVTSGRTFAPTVYCKDLQGYDEDGKPNYYYRALYQQLFVVDIDNEEHYKDEHGKSKKRCIENPLSIDKALSICKEHEIHPFFIYETFSSKLHREDPEKPYLKFRLCFLLDAPLQVQEYGNHGLNKVRNYFIGLFGAAADKATTDTSRLIYGTDEKERAKLFKCVIDSNKLMQTIFDDNKQPESDDNLPSLKPISANDLLKMDIAPLRFVIQDICPAGFGILAAPPKYHKSFLALQICAAISQGAKVLSKSTDKTKCLYFDLESTNRRPQERMKAMGFTFLDNVDFITQEQMPKVQNRMINLSTGFAELLGKYLNNNPDYGFVVIDVFKKIRSEQKRTQTLYDHDYADIEKLQSIAVKNNVCMLLLHHTTKIKDESDPYNNMGGSTGLLGAADFAWVITREKRAATESTLHITGRDIESNELSIKFNTESLNWEYIGTVEDVQAQKEVDEYNQSNIINTIKALVNTSSSGSWKGTVEDLIESSKYLQYPIYESAQKVGLDIQKYSALLWGLDYIEADKVRETNKRRQRIYEFVKCKK